MRRSSAPWPSRAVLFDFLFWGFGFLRMGTAGFTAQALGADDWLEQRAVLLRALVLAVAIGGLLVASQSSSRSSHSRCWAARMR